MRMVDLIQKKKQGHSLTQGEISFIVEGFTRGDIPDYQMAAFLMAVCLKGMGGEETAQLTLVMAHSGDMVDLSSIDGVKVDKHSTGGVGDKTTLILSPIVAACGVPVAKMSGKGLGHTGGTVDKLESIPGLKTAFTQEEFLNIVQRVGICVGGQSGNLAPADKKIYALRDVTGTVESLPLIASSIMSKKLAAGADAIVLDVKTGSGAFMKTRQDAIALAEAMVAIAYQSGRDAVALITEMDIPLGNAIGNSIEVIEAVETLRGNGPDDLLQVCKSLAVEMLVLAKKGDRATCSRLVDTALQSGAAFQKLVDMVKAQGGDPALLHDTGLFPKALYEETVVSPAGGFISSMDTQGIGIASSLLGAGREREDSVIDYTAGIYLHKKTGDKVAAGEPVATLYTSGDGKIPAAAHKLLESMAFAQDRPEPDKLIYARITHERTQRL